MLPVKSMARWNESILMENMEEKKAGNLMKKVHWKKAAIVAALVIVFIFSCLFYSRPRTLPQLYPMLTLEQCTEIRGYYKIGTEPVQSEFSIVQGSAEFQKLWDLFWKQSFCRSIRDIFPRGTRIHRTEPDDFQWDVYFYFDDVHFPDGSIGSGGMLHFLNWYGSLDIYFDGEVYACHTKSQDAWAKEILDIIR